MKRHFLRAWNSPTFTTWAELATRSLRLLLVTPLLLTRFDTTEIAAWYLFASLSFFGSMIHARVTQTFKRMIAFSMAGARDLSAIGNAKRRRGDGKPHWETVERAYGAVGFLTMITALLTAVSGLGLGYFSLSGILEGYPEPDKIWTALLITLGGQTFSMLFSQYMVTMRGMGLVALTNRWSCLFSLLSVLAGMLALGLGGGIVALSAAMSGVMLLNILRMKLLVSFVHGGRLRSVRSIAFDKEVILWAWPAFWRGLFTSIANRGVIQFGAVVYARYAPVEAVAAYLFSHNMLKTAASFSLAPLSSHNPLMSQTLARGDLGKLKGIFFKKAGQSQILLALTTAAIGFAAPYALEFIGSNSRFLDPLPWAILSGTALLRRYLLLGQQPLALGNVVLFVKANAIAAVISLSILIPMVKNYGFFGLMLAMFAPQLLLINIRPAIASARMFHIQPLDFLVRSCGWAVLLYITVQAAFVALTV